MRRALPLMLLLPALAAAAPALTVPPVARPAKLGQCVACHGEDGRSRIAGTPHLAAQDETYLVNALMAFRDGRRQGSPMNAIANTLQPRDIAALARWYATRAPRRQP